ncbi:hypothetical protein ACN47E_007072 [Coniothyrium glycines]
MIDYEVHLGLYIIPQQTGTNQFFRTSAYHLYQDKIDILSSNQEQTHRVIGRHIVGFEPQTEHGNRPHALGRHQLSSPQGY